MVLVPLTVFYILYIVAFKRDKKMLGLCGIAAVIATNIVIASYVYMAYTEDIKSNSSTAGAGVVVPDDKKKAD